MKENSGEKYSIVSFGIMEEEDIDLLLKQKYLFEKHTAENINFYVIPGREQYNPSNKSYIKLVEKIQKEFSLKCHTPQALSIDENITWCSEFTGKALEECFSSLPKGRYFYTHLDNVPIKDYSLNDLFKDKKVGGIRQTRAEIEYLWDNCLYIDSNNELIRNMNFKPCRVSNHSLDCGGESHFTLNNLSEEEKIFYPEGGIQLSDEEIINSLDILDNNKILLLENLHIQREEQKAFGDPHWSEVHIKNVFFHYRSFSGWHRKSERSKKIKQKRKDLLLKLE